MKTFEVRESQLFALLIKPCDQTFFINSGTLEMSSGENDSTSSDSSDEAAMMENDTLRSHRSTPLTKEMFDAMFDHSGRLIQEHELRKIIFKGTLINL